jgi:transketolase
MRRAFVQTLIDLAAADPRIVLLTGDLGYGVLEPFAERFPARFVNVGVAEQNMLGLATGLAEGGFVPFVYSIATFASLRAYEFLRNGPIRHGLPVRVVGVGGGFEYGPQGATHHGLEDLCVMRAQPGIAVVAPADHRQLAAALHATRDLPGPVYFRLGKNDVTTIPGLDGRFRLGRAERIRDGDDLALVVTGNVATEAVAAAEELAGRGVEASVLVVASVAPAPADDLADALGRVPLALTVEAHYATGGLGSLIAEVIAERGLACRLVRCGVAASPDGVCGSQAYLQERHGVGRDALVARALEAVRAGVLRDLQRRRDVDREGPRAPA